MSWDEEQQTVRAELIGSDTCIVHGITTRGAAPVLMMCRQLLAAGLDPDAGLDVYRGEMLALRVRSISEGARLRVASHGVGFEALPQCTGGSYVVKNGPALLMVARNDGWPADGNGR
jgi:hypothetical protein